ncbi:MAG: ABC transporter ATP-binding protein, partial [Clostridiales bacterium]|nr:ABC transporter ATP-binding protein [Clostridiales bacterium]
MNKLPQKKQKGVLKRTIKMLFAYYPKMMVITLLCILFNAVVSSLPSIFMERVFTYATEAVEAIKHGVIAASSGWAVYGGKITGAMLTLIGLYIASLISGAVYKQLLAIMTQGFLKKMRGHMFDGMQDLPIKYFDTNNNGDIMSYYTNDIDTLRQMISESLPQLLVSGIMVVTLFCIMLWYSLWFTLIVVVGVVIIVLVTKKVGGGAGKYFVAQQQAVGKVEGYIEEMMNGQKVVKVFCHEQQAKEGFDKVNDFLCDKSTRANRYANMLMPILGNIGHVLYVLVAIVGGVLIINDVNNVGIGVLFSANLSVVSVAIVVAFLQTTRQFTNNINQVSNQVNSVVMGI